MSSRRGLRSGRRRRTTTRSSSSHRNTDRGACIDLTVDIGGDEVIDLTHNSNIMDSPVVVIGPADDVGPVRRRRGSGRSGRRRSGSHGLASRFPYSSSSDDQSAASSSSSRVHQIAVENSDDELPDIPFAVPKERSSSSRAGQIGVENSDDELPDIPFKIPKESSKANASFCKSPPLHIQCPVCLDDLKQIKSNNRRVMSTMCGHIFCEDCIINAIRTYKSCPTCRKHLAQNKIHPLFL